jgi:hypothetical protein
MKKHLSSTIPLISRHNDLCKKKRMKERLKEFAKEVLRLLEGMRMAEEEWTRFVMRTVSRLGKRGKGLWK